MMNSTNGSFATQDYQHGQSYEAVAEAGTSEIFYQLIQASISEDVATQVNNLVTQGVLAASDITERVQAELVNLPLDLMNVITNELTSSDVSNLKNKAAYVIGLIKTQKKKVPGLSSLDSQTDLSMQGDNGSVDVDQLNITYGKHYKGTSLGPNVNDEAIKRLLLKSGYGLDLSPGQRQYGPPPNWQSAKPTKGCEVFIGGLLRETFEDTLVPMLEECGTIYDLRIMTNPTDGVNKGFAFCIFADKQSANTCVNKLNGKAMGRSRVLKVNVHDPNTRLFVGGVDKFKTRDLIFQAVAAVTEGLTDVILKGDTENPHNKHRGFVFLDYDEHKHASSAIKRLMLPQTLVFGKNLFAAWAAPMADVSDEVMATVKVLYVKGLTAGVSEDILRDRFSPYGAIDNVKKLKDYAFIHFQERDDALQAMNDLNGMRVEDTTLEVTLAKPGGKKKDPRAMGPGGPMMRGRGGPGGPGMRGGHTPLMGGPVGPPRGRGGGFGAPRGRGFDSPRGGYGAPRGGGYGAPRGGGYGTPRGGGGGYGAPRGGGGGYGAPRGGGGYGAPRGTASRGGPRGSPRGAPRGGARAPAAGYGASSATSSYEDFNYGYTDSYASESEYGSSYGSSHYRAPASSMGGRGARGGSARGAAAPYSLGYSQRDSDLPPSTRGYRSAASATAVGGALGRPPVKRPAPVASAYGGYDAYEAPAKRPARDSYDTWGASPIAQQPLSSHQAYGATKAADSWYTDTY